MTNNDEGAGYQRSLLVWRKAGSEARAESVTVTTGEGVVRIHADVRIPAGDTTASVVWGFHPSGQITVNPTVRPRGELPILPRIGMRCGVSAGLTRCTWFGRGPQENYEDRRAGAWTGIHSGEVAKLFYRYTDPQEAGLRTDVRWLELANADRRRTIGVAATGDHLLECAVIPVTMLSLETARNPIDLIESDEFVLRIDHRNTGVGGTNSWGEQPLECHRLQPRGDYSWQFLLSASARPISPASGDDGP